MVYRRALQRAIGAAAVPYGYTILNVAASGVLIETHGPPTVAAAALFICGAVAGFTVAALAAGGAGGPDEADAPTDGRWLGLCSGAAAMAGFACAALVAHAVAGVLAFGLVGLAATSVYLIAGALGAALIDRRDRSRTDGV